MCSKKQFKYCPSEIDECMIPIIEGLGEIINHRRFKIRACCCGHGKYPMTIIVEAKKQGFVDLVSGEEIPRKRNFYRKDKEGYYYIPETLNVE